MKMHLVSGRDLSRSDRQGSSGAAVVSETFARQFFAGQNPLGQRIRWKDNRYVPTDTGFQFGHLTVDEVEVVGVVADAKLQSLAKPPEPTIYMSSEQFIFRRRAVVVRTSLDKPESLVPVIRRELDSIDPQLGAQFGVYDSLIRTSIARERLGMTLLVVFGFAAMLLAAVGVYGLMSYSVATDRRDCRPIGDGGVYDAGHETRDGTRNGSRGLGSRSGNHRSRCAATGRRQ
jgi:hypothetical protein